VIEYIDKTTINKCTVCGRPASPEFEFNGQQYCNSCVRDLAENGLCGFSVVKIMLEKIKNAGSVNDIMFAVSDMTKNWESLEKQITKKAVEARRRAKTPLTTYGSGK